MEYEDRAKFAAERLLGYTKDPSGWKVCKKSNDVVVSWRPSVEYPGNVYKGEALVNGGLLKVWECLKPIPNGLRVKWDSNVKKFELLQQITEDVSVCRTVTPSAAMGIISPRDFVDVIVVKKYEDGTISSNVLFVSSLRTVSPLCVPAPFSVSTFSSLHLLSPHCVYALSLLAASLFCLSSLLFSLSLLCLLSPRCLFSLVAVSPLSSLSLLSMSPFFSLSLLSLICLLTVSPL
ncbi:hypothetical protein WMY93_013146 [Mugilogobius chulae]|uniref:START domain-containing protein n=1 Tax=Mugilogobius chulae TaxID=88201 RepID=A0AAW0NYM9_9GOBI